MWWSSFRLCCFWRKVREIANNTRYLLDDPCNCVQQLSGFTQHLEIYVFYTNWTNQRLRQNFPPTFPCSHGRFYSHRGHIDLGHISHYLIYFTDFRFWQRLCALKRGNFRRKRLIFHTLLPNAYLIAFNQASQTKDMETTEIQSLSLCLLLFKISQYQLRLIMSILGHRR